MGLELYFRAEIVSTRKVNPEPPAGSSGMAFFCGDASCGELPPGANGSTRRYTTCARASRRSERRHTRSRARARAKPSFGPGGI